MTLRVLVGGLFLGLVGCVSQPQGHLRQIGESRFEAFEIDTDSIRREGDIARFTLYSHSTGTFHTAYQGSIGVDCVRHRRIEYRSSVEFGESRGRRVAGDDAWYDVLPGTRQAQELEFVCAQPHSAIGSDPAPRRHDVAVRGAETVPPALAPATVDGPPSGSTPPLAPVPFVQPVRFATGLLLSADGLLITRAAVANGCARIEVTAGGAAHSGVLLHLDQASDLALLKIDGTGYAALPASLQRPALHEPVTVLGYADSADPADEQPPVLRVAAATVFSLPVIDTSAGILMPDNAGEVTGSVLNARGEVVGVMLQQALLTPQGRVGWQVGAPELKALLQRWGVEWPLRAAPDRRSDARRARRGDDMVQILRRAAEGSALVMCRAS